MKKTWFAACIAASVGAGVCHLYLLRFERERAGGALQAVVMVTRDVSVGDTLSEPDLSFKEVPERFVEERQIVAKDRDQLVGARITTALPVGSSVQWTDVDAAPDGRTLASLVRSGLRAVSLRSAEAGFEGLLRPGDRVDVLFTDNSDRDRHTALLVQNALVLTVGDDLGNNLSGARKTSAARQVSLSVSLMDAQRIAHARGRGALTLALRNPGDIASLAAAAVVRDDALGAPQVDPKGARDAR